MHHRLAGRLVRGKGEKRMSLTYDPNPNRLLRPLRDGLLAVASPGQYKVQGVSYGAIQKVHGDRRRRRRRRHRRRHRRRRRRRRCRRRCSRRCHCRYRHHRCLLCRHR